jgi:hypothetical protein
VEVRPVVPGNGLLQTPDGSVHFDNPYRHEYGCILASLIRVVRDITLAEDALQDGSFSLAT